MLLLIKTTHNCIWHKGCGRKWLFLLNSQKLKELKFVSQLQTEVSWLTEYYAGIPAILGVSGNFYACHCKCNTSFNNYLFFAFKSPLCGHHKGSFLFTSPCSIQSSSFWDAFMMLASCHLLVGVCLDHCWKPVKRHTAILERWSSCWQSENN